MPEIITRGNIVFVLVVVPLGILLAAFPDEISKFFSELLNMEVTRASLGVFYIIFAIVILRVFKKSNKNKLEHN